MQVILTQDVKNLGKKYSLANVKDGYWRNFLNPQGLAVAASKANVENLKKAEAHVAALRAEERARAEKFVTLLAGRKITIVVKASKEGTLFGSVRGGDIARSVQSQLAFPCDADQVILGKPIHTLGEYAVTIRPEKDVEGKLIVVVEAEKN